MSNVFEQIIVPIDGSEYALKAAKKGLVLADILKVPITAIYVLNPQRFAVDAEIMSSLKVLLENKAYEYLEEIKALAKDVNCSLSTKIIVGIPSEEIISTAGVNDLIILGHKGQTGLSRVFVGNVSEKVIHHAKCSVMIIR
jgi:nucleotide-binding universal stress UspA family protein